MAIEKNKLKLLITEINTIFEQIMPDSDEKTKDWITHNVLGPAIEEIKTLINDSRPPVIYIIGRSGHGKSSLINALSGKKVAEVGDVRPTTYESTLYNIIFEETYSEWDIIDSRGFFESTTPDGAVYKNAKEYLSLDIKKRKPDVILHVLSATELRSMQNDMMFFNDLMGDLISNCGVKPPSLIIANKVDLLGNPKEFPPEKYPAKSGLIKDSLDYLATEIFKKPFYNIDSSITIKGLKSDNNNYVGIIPVCSLSTELWNINTLSNFLGEYLPECAQLLYYQAQRNKFLLKKISDRLIKRISSIAGIIGSSPIPISDIIILTPLQILLIAIIGGLSCRNLSKETAFEFFSAAGLNIGASFGSRYAAQQLLKIVPFAGWALSGIVAAASTYGIGKSAELYFFNNEIKNPMVFAKKYEE